MEGGKSAGLCAYDWQRRAISVWEQIAAIPARWRTEKIPLKSAAAKATSPNQATRCRGFCFTYHMQELAFFSWFYGAPSVGVNGCFSDNAKFLHDAGPVCHSVGAKD